MQIPTVDLIRSTNFAHFMRAYLDMIRSTAVRLSGNDAPARDIIGP